MGIQKPVHGPISALHNRMFIECRKDRARRRTASCMRHMARQPGIGEGTYLPLSCIPDISDDSAFHLREVGEVPAVAAEADLPDT
jgi:hypothetical protein